MIYYQYRIQKGTSERNSATIFELFSEGSKDSRFSFYEIGVTNSTSIDDVLSNILKVDLQEVVSLSIFVESLADQIPGFDLSLVDASPIYYIAQNSTRFVLTGNPIQNLHFTFDAASKNTDFGIYKTKITFICEYGTSL